MPLYLSKHFLIFTFVTTVDRPISAERKKGGQKQVPGHIEIEQDNPIIQSSEQHCKAMILLHGYEAQVVNFFDCMQGNPVIHSSEQRQC